MAKGTHFKGPIGQGSGLVEVIGAAKTLTQDDNGKVFLLTTDATDGATVVLPLHRSGFSVKFMVGATFATTNWIIDHNAATDDTMEGSIIVDGADIDVDAAKAINFVASAENIGDWITVLSDGTTWFVTGVGGNSGSITVTA